VTHNRSPVRGGGPAPRGTPLSSHRCRTKCRQGRGAAGGAPAAREHGPDAAPAPHQVEQRKARSRACRVSSARHRDAMLEMRDAHDARGRLVQTGDEPETRRTSGPGYAPPFRGTAKSPVTDSGITPRVNASRACRARPRRSPSRGATSGCRLRRLVQTVETALEDRTRAAGHREVVLLQPCRRPRRVLHQAGDALELATVGGQDVRGA